MIKAVLFDIDGVLVDSLEANAHFFSELFTHAGYKPLTVDEYKPYFHYNMRKMISHHIDSDNEDEIDRIWQMGSDRTLYNELLIEPTPDLEKVITNLHQRYKLGIVTSRIRRGVTDLPDLKKLLSHFEVVVTYEDTKVHKPDPAPLLFACEKLSLKSEECIYIGDSASDIQAARSAGMKSILFNDEIFESPDAHTNIFSELPLKIESISN